MISPDRVCDEAKKKDDENYHFRLHLKTHAEAEELDERFLRLHNELFVEYDCSECRNCCKMYKGNLEERDIIRAKVLGIEKEQLIDHYLIFNEILLGYSMVAILSDARLKER